MMILFDMKHGGSPRDLLGVPKIIRFPKCSFFCHTTSIQVLHWADLLDPTQPNWIGSWALNWVWLSIGQNLTVAIDPFPGITFVAQYKRANETLWTEQEIRNETKAYITPLQKSAWYQARIKAQKKDAQGSESPWTPVFLFSVPADKSMLHFLGVLTGFSGGPFQT